MPYFKTDDDLLDAVGDVPDETGPMKMPRNLPRAKAKKSVAWGFSWNCGCSGTPIGRGDDMVYTLHVGPDCKKHGSVKGNIERPPSLIGQRPRAR